MVAGLAAAVLLLGVVFFFRYKDPMILVFALLAAVAAAAVAFVAGSLRGAVGGARVRCGACERLNVEDARFCVDCGRPMR